MKKRISKKGKRLLSTLFAMAATVAVGFVLAHQTNSASANNSDQQPMNQTDYFISQIGEPARQLGQDNDLYASVMIAQAILESGSGQSGLSDDPHYNLFGIKGQYDGQSATMQTWEDDGQGNAYTINDSFRSYPSYVESLQDYVTVLKQGHFAGAWKSNTSSYQDATAALTGVYATDSSYNSKLNYIIEKYDLTRFDSPSFQSGADYMVYNPYRQQYTTQDVLDIDTAWANRF
ncbi:glucosaminidase domain-containing protein [Streptococcus panodentis]|uniref:N-acetylmuramoyl-L-alanine amidase n=1 Tax=Streptococcus panodentis TaxID=1581472 RepID=A0ABS5ATG7_9STRE|nr:glucosaminidase domain-containing protein [Streptococcus sp. DD11]KXT81260.1 Peptidoglycan hydrolase, Autolysin2 [Streptococcus sp. DD11]MBP2619867.1 N-acetylmuramoyl-L-alanine amidase [Streptococcus panodentis]